MQYCCNIPLTAAGLKSVFSHLIYENFLISFEHCERGYKCVGEIVKPATYVDIKAGFIKVSRKTPVSRNSHKKYSHIHNKDIENGNSIVTAI